MHESSETSAVGSESTTNRALVRVEKAEKTGGFDIEEVEEQRRSSGRRRSSGVSVASSRLSSSSSSTPGTPSRLSIRAVADRYKRVSVVRRLSIAESRRTKDALASDDVQKLEWSRDEPFLNVMLRQLAERAVRIPARASVSAACCGLQCEMLCR